MVTERFESLKILMDDLPDPQDRLEYFVGRAADCCLDCPYRKECFRVTGCISNLWIVPSLKEGCCYFECDGDAVIPKGIAKAVLDVFSGATPQAILDFDEKALQGLGIVELLSPNRRNALSRVVATVRSFATAVLAQARANETAKQEVLGV